MSRAPVPERRPGRGSGTAARRRGISSRPSAWRFLIRAAARIEDSPIGDAIGCACLFVTFFTLLILAGVLS
jgi:hypothetical protein